MLTWLIPRAKILFETEMSRASEHKYGGIFYGFASVFSLCDHDKIFCVQAESYALAALLTEATGEQKYWQSHERIWAYSWP
jgi:mannose/cellobiose epimerase-like protein (N-acyl-D-glucosamine 2-epimerase family)